MRWTFPILVMLAGCTAPTKQTAATAQVLPSSAAEMEALKHCQPGAKWTEPARPLQIHGNTRFVGTCGLTALLLTSSQGHVLIDGGTKDTAPLIEANIRRIGYRVEDIRYIINSHEHYDHAGGIAQLQRDSGAVVVAREPAARAFERGRGDRSDPQFLSVEAFAPVANVRRIGDGETLTLGQIKLTAHATPGHTPGSTTWTWESCEMKQCVHVVYADSLTAISDDVYRYSDESQNPGVAAAFRASIATIANLPCDILLTPHPDASAIWSRLGDKASAPLVDRDACRNYAANASEKFEARLMQERASATH